MSLARASTCALLGLGTLLLALAPTAAMAAPHALLPFAGPAAAADRDATADALRPHLAAQKGVALVSEREARDHVAAAFALGGPCALDRSACVARVLALSALSRAIAGTVTPAGDGLQVALVLFGPGGKELRRAELVIDRAGPRRDGQLALLAVLLVEPDAAGGHLIIHVDQVGAAVMVDDTAVGWSPVTPVFVHPGLHRVYVAAQGRESFETTVDVPLGATVTVEAVLLRSSEPAAPPPAGSPTASDVSNNDGPVPAANRPFPMLGVFRLRDLAGSEGFTGAVSDGLVSSTAGTGRFLVVTEADMARIQGIAVGRCGEGIVCARNLATTLHLDGFIIGDVQRRDDVVVVSAARYARGEADPVAECLLRHRITRVDVDAQAAQLGQACATALLDAPTSAAQSGLSPAVFWVAVGTAIGGLPISGAGGALFLAGTDETLRTGGAIFVGVGLVALGVGATAALITWPMVDWD